MIITPGDYLSQKKWIRDACDELLAAMENPHRSCFITPQEWELIRNREPVGGCSDVTEVLQKRIAAYCEDFLPLIRVIRDGGSGSGWEDKAPGYMMVLTDWQTLSGPGRYIDTYSEVMDWTKEYPNALVWPTSGKIVTDECIQWYFTEQPLPRDNADFVLFVPPEGTARAREAVIRELGEYGGPGEVFTVTITEWFGPQFIRE